MTAEPLAEGIWILRCLVDPSVNLGKYTWVCTLVSSDGIGVIKAFGGTREPLMSELRDSARLGRALGVEECDVCRLDEHGSMRIRRKLWKRQIR